MSASNFRNPHNMRKLLVFRSHLGQVDAARLGNQRICLRLLQQSRQFLGSEVVGDNDDLESIESSS